MSASSFDRAVRREKRRLLRSRPVSPYGHDSRRRERARQDAADAAKTRRRCYETLIVLLAAAIFIIGWDHARGPINLTDPAGSTSTPHPHERGDGHGR